MRKIQETFQILQLMLQMTRKKIRKERLWNHFKYYIPNRVFGSDLREIRNYDPELYKDKFLDFQSNGRRNLTLEDYENIKPLIDAQGLKDRYELS